MAKKFQFRLARLHKLRERARERRRLEHAEAVQFQHRVEDQIDQVSQVRQQEKEVLKQTLGSPAIPVDQVIQARAYDTLLGTVGANLNRQRDQILQVVEQRRQTLVAAERDVRVLEKLEEKARGRYDATQARVDVAAMDELASRASVRRAEIMGPSSEE